jgi:hypothetical protein
MKYLRPILSVASIAFLVFWSRLILPLRKEQMPFSGWGDGSTGNATTLAVPVVTFWLATVFAFLFVCFNPYARIESGLTRLGRWLTNAVLLPVALALVFYAMHGPPVRFLFLYGFIALIGLWIYIDVKGRSERLKGEKSP